MIQSNDLVAYEDLNVQGMIKKRCAFPRERAPRDRKLAKSISDAGWSSFRQWLEYFGDKYGKATVAVPPQYTSQICSHCGVKVKKSLSTRTHVCQCGYVEDRDVKLARSLARSACVL